MALQLDFFHHCWSMVREDVWKLVEESRTSGQVLSALNATFLTLIPKEERVSQPNQFRPIVLCNVVYKIITKVISLFNSSLFFPSSSLRNNQDMLRGAK
jgi:hypothetical protein